jgi:5'-3' exoribonuclease 2
VRTPSGKPTPLAKGAIGALVMDQDESDEEPEDEIRFWEAGWKSRYYRAKFQVSESDKEFRKKVACAYVEGLAWVLRYYYQVGVSSLKFIIMFDSYVGMRQLDMVLPIPLCTICIRF